MHAQFIVQGFDMIAQNNMGENNSDLELTPFAFRQLEHGNEITYFQNLKMKNEPTKT